MTTNKTCLNCGKRFKLGAINSFDIDYCSIECFKEDAQRLEEGNKIIQSALKNESLSELQKLKLDVSGPMALALGTMIKFGSEATPSPLREEREEREEKED